MLARIKKYWTGEFVPYDNLPKDSFAYSINSDDGLIVIGGYFKYPLVRKILEPIYKFLRRDWKYWLSTLIGIVATYYTYKATK